MLEEDSASSTAYATDVGLTLLGTITFLVGSIALFVNSHWVSR